MALIALLNNQPGPLPVKTTFKSPSDRGVTLTISGSLRSTGAPTLIGFQVLIDGKVLSVSHIWSNADNIHRATVPVNVPAPQDFNQHTLTLQTLNNNSVGDQNDFFTAILDY